MKLLYKYILFFVLIGISISGKAQFDPNGVCIVENGKLIFKLDLRWTVAQKNEINKLFKLDSTVWKKISLNTSEILLDSIPWKLKKISPYLVELSKVIENKPVLHLNDKDIFLIDENWRVALGYVDQEKVIYGANNFTKNNCFIYTNGYAQFFLPGYTKSPKVYIAGSFNDWNPEKTAMLRTDSGWLVRIPLPVGKHFYKFILNGNWMVDPYNKISEDDGQGNVNSVVYCPNFKFKLKGYNQARKVFVTGTFNKWNGNELRMHREKDTWVLPLYLKEGTYSYKFAVDDVWISDPENDNKRKDGKGNLNSVLGTGEVHVFKLNGFTSAKRVFLAGNFNNWNSNELMMDKTSVGWQLPYQMAPGNYEYKFIIDGRWIADPSNPYTAGINDFINSCLALKPNHTFVLQEFPNAREVKVTGDFNNWNPDGNRMVKQNGKWIYPVYLTVGKHLYKFIVDGKWILDPANKLWEENEFGTGNSIIWTNK